MADGDLASIFRQRQLPVSDPWGVPVPPQNLPKIQPLPQSSQDSDNVRWDYPNSLSPQSPFEYHDGYTASLNARMLQSKAISGSGPPYNHTYSSLRPPALNHQQLFNQSPQLPIDQSTLSCRKRDYQGANFQMRVTQPTLGSGVRNAFAETSAIAQPSQDQNQNFVAANQHRQPLLNYNVGFEHGHGQGQGLGQGMVWPRAAQGDQHCKVDELASELQSELLRDMRPGSGYMADHHPARLLQNGYSEMLLQQNQGVNPGCGDKRTPAGGATGLQLVHLLLACAEAVANEQMDLAHVVLARLKTMLTPCTTTMQRLGAVFADALHARITRTATSGRYLGLHKDHSVAILDMLQSFSVIYEYTPFIKLPHLTLNQIILDSIEGESHVHVIDLNMSWGGMQWPAFIQALALRPGGPPKLRISSIGKPDDLEHSREKLQDYARNLHVPFEFCPLVVDLQCFDVRMLNIRDWEVVCINSVNQFHQLLKWGDERFHRFLCELRSLNPRVVAYMENDADLNSPKFLPRFFECLRYYSAVYDALDASFPPGSVALHQVEHLFTSQKIRNIVACEGTDRITRHEKIANWSRRMEMAGFRPKPIGSRAISQARLLLHLYFAQSGYSLRAENGAVVLGWDNTPLMGATAWRI